MTPASSAFPSQTPGALAGIRVMDFSQMLAGPYCTRLLADAGAEVLKIEPPGGDHIRIASPLRDGHSSYFGHLNCGKKSVCLDLKLPEAQALIRRLVRRTDVVLENFRPGVMGRLGLDYETLRQEKPDLVFCSISGFGQSGPGAGRPAYAPIVHAASGFDLANMKHQEGATRPAKTSIFVADILGGALAASAIQTALIHRLRTGEGQRVDTALMDGMLSLLVYDMQATQFPSERRRPIYTPVAAADGFIVVAPITQANFEALARATGHPEWLGDPRFAVTQNRSHHWAELMELVEQWSRTRPAAESEALIDRAGCPCSRYLTLAEAMRDPQVLYRESLAMVEDAAGEFLVANTPYKLSATPAAAHRWVADLGQHNHEVMTGLLDMSRAEIAALEARKVLCSAAEAVHG